jgi:hypothetical protein
LHEILRGLKPGGEAVVVAWGDLDCKILMRTVMAPFAKRKQPPELPAGAPHPFRLLHLPVEEWVRHALRLDGSPLMGQVLG